MVEASDHLQVLVPGQILVDRRVLPGQPDLGPELRRVGDNVEPGDPGAAGVGTQQRGQDPDRGRLARAVRPEQTENAALWRAEVDTAERLHLAEGLLQSFRLDCRLISHRQGS